MSNQASINLKKAIKRAVEQLYAELDCDSSGIFLKSNTSIKNIMSEAGLFADYAYPTIKALIRDVCRPDPVKVDCKWFVEVMPSSERLPGRIEEHVLLDIDEILEPINEFVDQYERVVKKPSVSPFDLGESVGRVVLGCLAYVEEGAIFVVRQPNILEVSEEDGIVLEIARDFVEAFEQDGDNWFGNDLSVDDIRAMMLRTLDKTHLNMNDADRKLFANGFFADGVLGFSNKVVALKQTARPWYLFGKETLDI